MSRPAASMATPFRSRCERRTPSIEISTSSASRFTAGAAPHAAVSRTIRGEVAEREKQSPTEVAAVRK